jgi:hypothetical protein
MTKRKASTLAVLYPEAHPEANGSALYPEAADADPGVSPDELAHALVEPEEPEASAPAPSPSPAPVPRPRRISIEVVKAETRLIQIERNRDESLQRQALSWDDKRASFIASLPDDVRAALVALKVLGEDDLTSELEPADD